MALQKCPECGGQVSNQATVCPHCGRPQGSTAISRAVELLKVVPISIGILTLIFGVVQYKKAQDWKRSEFVAAEMRNFVSKLEVRQAILMIEWNGLDVRLFPEKPPGEDVAWVTDKDLSYALRLLDSPPELNPFSVTHARIRDYFDVFFEGLEPLGHFAKARLVDKADLEPYLDRWVSVLGDTAPGKPRVLRTYVHCSGYLGVKHLIDLWGFQAIASIPCPNLPIT